jgi:hypothetical protein
MKRVFLSLLLIGFWTMGFGQLVSNPMIAIKPIATLSITKVILTDTTTSVTVRIVNAKGMAPFTLRTRDLYIRKVSEPTGCQLIRAEKAPFAPEKHVFTTPTEAFEFTLVFSALPKGTKYFDLMENMPKKEFYVQGIILDSRLNEILTRGFDLFAKADGNGALKAFIEFANADLYFEYGVAYFNIIYILALANRIPEAQEWYNKFKEKFFYDKKLLENEFARLGVRQKLK